MSSKLVNRHVELIEGDFLQKELYEKYESAENEDQRMFAALELYEYNYNLGFGDKFLYSYINETLYHNEFYSGKDFSLPNEGIYKAWFKLLISSYLRFLDIEDSLKLLALEPYSPLRDEVLLKNNLANIEELIKTNQKADAKACLKKVKIKLSMDKNLQKFSKKIDQLEKQLN